LRAKPRRGGTKRLALLALAIAVPAMAAPGMDRQENEGPTITFPMADVPDLAEREVESWIQFEEQVLPLEPSADSFTGPIAASLKLTGSSTDMRRAKQCLAMAVYYEAASEGLDGQRAVAQVVMNRVQHPHFPNTVCGVVFEGSERSTGCQFSFTCDGSLNRNPSTRAFARAQSVASAALDGYVYQPVGLATHYHTTSVNPYWASSLDPVGRVGLHQFYRWRGSAGRASAFVASYGGGEPLPARTYSSASHAPVEAQIPVQRVAAPPVSRSMAPASPPALPSLEIAGHELSGTVNAEYARSGEWLVQP